MKTILCVISHYIPGYKAGGAVRSVEILAEYLSGLSDFRVLTSDRDLGDKVPYSDIEFNKWVSTNNYRVMYIKKNFFKILFSFLRDAKNVDILYLNSFFDLYYSILPFIFSKFLWGYNFNVILAPRGEFSPGALNIKSYKKRLYAFFAKLTRLYTGVTWHASTALEKSNIVKFLAIDKKHIMLVPDNINGLFGGKISCDRIIGEGSVKNNPIKVCFISRISRKKNLQYALKVLGKIDFPLVFDVYGPVEDNDYYMECKNIVSTLPKNVDVYFKGSVNHENVISVFSKYNLFLFPTCGENYGHVIAESFKAGTPVLISDQTPWNGLAGAGVGWDFPLNEMQYFVHALNLLNSMSDHEYNNMRNACYAYKFNVEGEFTVSDLKKAFFVS